MTASAAATTASEQRVRDERRRPRHKAHAAKHAMAPAEWPLGNEFPEKPASGAMSGRGRPTMSFTRLVATFAPPTATSRKSTTPRERVRRTSNPATSTLITSRARVLPRWVKVRNTSVLKLDAWSAAHSAMDRSTRATVDRRRTSKASTPTTTNRPSTIVSASPVTSAGLARRRRKAAVRPPAESSCCTNRAVWCTAPWRARPFARWTHANPNPVTAPATTPATTSTAMTAIEASPCRPALRLFPTRSACNPANADEGVAR